MLQSIDFIEPEMYNKWLYEHLFVLLYLSPYSPELNLIEILWLKSQRYSRASGVSSTYIMCDYLDEITNQITHIATAAEEQSLVTEEINRNLRLISYAASQLADLSAQAGDSSEALNAQRRPVNTDRLFL